MTRRRSFRAAAAAAGSLALVLGGVATSPAVGQQRTGSERAEKVAAHWTPERLASAVPRDLVVDERGLGYLRGRDGSLEPYGHSLAAIPPLRALPADVPSPRRPPSGGASDTAGPEITDLDPAGGETIPSEYDFSATVSDASGVKSVSFVITYPDGFTTQSITAVNFGGDQWGRTITGFTEGDWSWHVVAKDNAARGGNISESSAASFTVGQGTGGGSSGGGGSTDPSVVVNDEWADGGTVQTAAGRLYFEMPRNARQSGPWNAYVCSGTVVSDDLSDASMVLTAAHCVYDDRNGAFARNVLFIPNQAGTTGTRTDTNCDNDPLGCWVPDYGVVDDDWAGQVWPDNIPVDFGFYLIPTTGAHTGKGAEAESLEDSAKVLPVSFSSQNDLLTTALGYSYSDDPKLMYCQEPLDSEETHGGLWLGSCGLSGGASGGPWLQLAGGADSIVSVNSWGYSNGDPGMGGPRLERTANCLFEYAGGHKKDAVVDC